MAEDPFLAEIEAMLSEAEEREASDTGQRAARIERQPGTASKYSDGAAISASNFTTSPSDAGSTRDGEGDVNSATSPPATGQDHVGPQVQMDDAAARLDAQADDALEPHLPITASARSIRSATLDRLPAEPSFSASASIRSVRSSAGSMRHEPWQGLPPAREGVDQEREEARPLGALGTERQGSLGSEGKPLSRANSRSSSGSRRQSRSAQGFPQVSDGKSISAELSAIHIAAATEGAGEPYLPAPLSNRSLRSSAGSNQREPATRSMLPGDEPSERDTGHETSDASHLDAERPRSQGSIHSSGQPLSRANSRSSSGSRHQGPGAKGLPPISVENPVAADPTAAGQPGDEPMSHLRANPLEQGSDSASAAQPFQAQSSSHRSPPTRLCEPRPMSPDWCLMEYGNGKRISRQELSRLLKEYDPASQGLKISAAEFDRLDLDKDGWLNRDEFYLFFYGWLSSKIPTDELDYHDSHRRQEAHQLNWIYDVYRCVSGVSLEMSLRPWSALCKDAGLLDQRCRKHDVEIIYKRALRPQPAREVKAGLYYEEFLEALRTVSEKKEASYSDVIEMVLRVGSSDLTKMGRNRYRDLASSTLTPSADSDAKTRGQLHASLCHELYASRPLSWRDQTGKARNLTRRTVEGGSGREDLHEDEHARKGSPPTAQENEIANLAMAQQQLQARVDELEAKVAGMGKQREDAEEFARALQKRAGEQNAEIAQLRDRNEALHRRISELEDLLAKSEQARGSSDEYASLLEQSLTAAVNKQPLQQPNAGEINQELMTELQRRATGMPRVQPSRRSIMEHLYIRREKRHQSRKMRKQGMGATGNATSAAGEESPLTKYREDKMESSHNGTRHSNS